MRSERARAEAGAGLMVRTGSRRWRAAAMVVAAGVALLLGTNAAAAGPATAQLAAQAEDAPDPRQRADHFATLAAEAQGDDAVEAQDLLSDGVGAEPAVHDAIPLVDAPAEDARVVDLARGGSGTADLGPMEVAVAAPDGAAAPDLLKVAVADAAKGEAAGVAGVVFEVTDVSVARSEGDDGDTLDPAEDRVGTLRVDEPATVEVDLEVDYSRFAGLAGGDWGSRLQLVEVPQCAATFPQEPDCRPRPVASENDLKSQTVSATVEIPAAKDGSAVLSGGLGMSLAGAASSGESSTFALSAGVSGQGGDWSATGLSAVGSWSHGGATGSFSWSYPLRVPQGVTGPKPELSLSYSSASADGRVASSNNQTSWVGEGWDLTQNYVERRYVSCSSDTDPVDDKSPNNAGWGTGDLCWDGQHVTMVLNGSHLELVKDPSDGDPDRELWKGEKDDGTRIERVASSSVANGAGGEYWIVTTVDGTQYRFGSTRRDDSGGDRQQSTWTVPVYGNHPGEPGYATAFADSMTTKAWRWNLDQVSDPSGNTMSYTWFAESNWYAADFGDGGNLRYDRGGWLRRVEYGTRSGSSATAPARVDFSVGERCTPATGVTCASDGSEISDPDKAQRWFDTPADLLCTSTASCDTYSPTFFTRKLLKKVTTQTHDGTAYRPVDSWDLGHEWQEPGDGSLNYGLGRILWLDSIQHSGHGGTATTADDIDLPATSFNGMMMPGRVDTVGDSFAPMNRPRLTQIVTEAGGRIEVGYLGNECTTANKPGESQAAQEANRMRCFPVTWTPQGVSDPVVEYFHKYVVETVLESGNAVDAGPEGDTVTGSQETLTAYKYPSGGPVWVKPTGGPGDPADRTFSEMRGYAKVTTLVGKPEDGAQQKTVTRYYRGLGGDISVTAGGTTVTAKDRERFTGQTFSVRTFNGLTPVTTTATVLTQAPTATSSSGKDLARRVSSQQVRSFTHRADGKVEFATDQTTTFDEFGQTVEVDDRGGSGSADDLCTRVTYSRTSTHTDKHLMSLALRSWTSAGTCTSPGVKLTDSKNTYDSAGRVTGASAYDPERSSYVKDFQAVTYDALGRVTSVTDALGRQAKTAYSPSGAGLLTKVSNTSPDPDGTGPLTAHTSSATYDPLMGTLVASADANGKTTRAEYDALGRRTQVALPQHDGASDASMEYEYSTPPSRNGLNAVVSKTLGADGQRQHVEITHYDGLLRPFQTQSESVDAGVEHTDSPAERGRMVAHTYYDSAGREAETVEPFHATGAPSTTPVAVPGDPGASTVSVFDGVGRVTDEIFYIGTPSNPDHEQWRTTTRYDGAYKTVKAPDGGTSTTTVTDALGRPVAMWEHTAAISLAAGFDARTVSTSSYQKTSYTYDRLGQLTRMQDPINDGVRNSWTYSYDYAGRPVEAGDPNKGTTSATYDAAGQVTEVTDPNGTLTYTYDRLGRPTTLSQGSTVRAEWAYDEVGSTTVKGALASSTRIADGDRYTTSVTAYDDAYQPLGVTVELPDTTDLGPLAGQSYTTAYEYTADGQVERLSLPKVMQGSSQVLGSENVTTYYDSASQPHWMGGGFGWGIYVAESRVTTDGDPLVTDLGNTYGAVVSHDYGAGTKRLQGITLDRERIDGTEVDLSYTYDDAGNVTKLSDAPTASRFAPASKQDHQCFSYTRLRQLSQAWTPADGNCASPSVADMGGAAEYWTQWSYDPWGNRTQQVQRTSAGQVTTDYSHGVGGAGPHAVTGVETTDDGGTTSSMTFGYDGAGNQTSRTPADSGATQLLGWDVEGRLAEVVTSGAAASGEGTVEDGEASFVYDANGSRLTRSDAAGTTVYLPGGQELHVTPAGHVSATRYYEFAGNVVAVRTDRGLGGVTSLVTDHQGTVVAAVPNTTWTAGSVVRSYSSPFGGVRGQADGSGSVTDGVPGDHGFLDKPVDSTGFHQVGARYYDADLGRFLSVDPKLDAGTPAQFNAYLYSGQNPITWSDPTGMSWLGDAWKSTKSFVKKHQADIVGIAVGVAVTVGCTAATGGAGVVGCAVAGGAAAGAATNLWRTKVQKTQKFTWGGLVRDTAIGGATGLIGGGAGKAALKVASKVAPRVTAATTRSVSAARKTVSSRASATVRAVASKARSGGQKGGAATRTSSRPSGSAGACKLSFAGATLVLLADGSTKPIDQLEPGDEVWAADPETGQKGGREVEQVHVHDDVMLTLVIDGRRIVTTEDHPFWSQTQGEFVRADHLAPGDKVRNADGGEQTVDGIDAEAVVYAPAYNLTVAGLHTYHVLAPEPAREPSSPRGPPTQTATLVHNCGDATFLRQTVHAEAGRADFIASADGVVVPTSRNRLVAGFEEAGLQSTPTISAGTQYTLPDGSLARVMEPSSQAGLRASFTNAKGGPINPFTGKPVQPPPGLSKPERRDYTRGRTHIELGP